MAWKLGAAQILRVPLNPPISAVVITRDAARLLRTVLDALRWCDELLVVDSGSTDDYYAVMSGGQGSYSVTLSK